MFGELCIKCRNFRDPNNPNATGLRGEIPDMAKLQEFPQSDAGKRSMQEDGLKGRNNAGVGRVHSIVALRVERNAY